MTLFFTAQDQVEFEKKQKEVHFHSKLGFLNAHNGFRRGCIHLVLGTTGGGKSTLMRTILRDIIFHPENTCHTSLWLSEESIADYKAQMALGMPSHERLMNTSAFSELEMEDKSDSFFFKWLNMNKPDILILDNITTSTFYMDKMPSAQAHFASKLKQVTKNLNIATVLVAHTDAKVSDSRSGFITINDIRGSKSICNLVEFAYILQRFELGTDFFPTVRIVKSRNQTLLHNLYSLKYDKNLRSYVSDASIDFKQFKEVYGKRNRLD